MKRILFLSLILLHTSITFAQTEKQKVAVYITDKSDFNIGEFAGDFLVNAIVKRGTYTAVERTSDFLKELKNEQTYQRTGSVDDNQISRLGKQFGVQLVCAVKVSKMGDSHFMSARLIDVETANLLSSSRPQKFEDIETVEAACDAITASLFGGNIKDEYSATKENSLNQVIQNRDKELVRVVEQNVSFIESKCGCLVQTVDAKRNLSMNKISQEEFVIISKVNMQKKEAGVKPNFYVGQIQVALNSFCPKGWRVPTLEELKCIYENRDNIGGFDNREVYYSDEIYTGVLYIGFYGVNFKKDGEEKKIKKSGNLRCVKDIVQ